MTTLRGTAAAYGVQRPEARRTEVCMANLMMQLSETVCVERGTFHPRSNEQTTIRGSDLLVAPQELVEALDKRGHFERAEKRRSWPTRAGRGSTRLSAFLRRRDADRISSMHTPKGTPMKNNSNEQRNAISGWEGEGGAVISDESGTGIVQSEKRAGEQERRDASHQSDVRGEHRYPDAHQTAAEQTARRNRDDLKGRLAGRLAPGSERKLRRK